MTMNNTRIRTILLALAIVAVILGVVATEDAGEVLSLTGVSWVAIAIGLIAGSLLS